MTEKKNSSFKLSRWYRSHKPPRSIVFFLVFQNFGPPRNFLKKFFLGRFVAWVVSHFWVVQCHVAKKFIGRTCFGRCPTDHRLRQKFGLPKTRMTEKKNSSFKLSRWYRSDGSQRWSFFGVGYHFHTHRARVFFYRWREEPPEKTARGVRCAARRRRDCGGVVPRGRGRCATGAACGSSEAKIR